MHKGTQAMDLSWGHVWRENPYLCLSERWHPGFPTLFLCVESDPEAALYAQLFSALALLQMGLRAGATVGRTG